MSAIKRLDGWRALVPSDVIGNHPYLVDLTSYSGNGRCACKHFETFCKRNLNAGLRNVDDKTRCKHIRQFRNLCMDIILARHIAEQKRTLGRKDDDGR